MGTWKLENSDLEAWEYKIKHSMTDSFKAQEKKSNNNFGFSKAWKFCNKWAIVRILFEDFIIEPFKNHMVPPLSMHLHHNHFSSSNFPNHVSNSNSTNKILNTIKLSIKCINPNPHLEVGNNFQTQVQIWQSYLDHRHTF